LKSSCDQCEIYRTYQGYGIPSECHNCGKSLLDTGKLLPVLTPEAIFQKCIEILGDN